ncbi:MAG: pentapeptide repeat-containing protein, partial [Acidimicrobiales bacterium]
MRTWPTEDVVSDGRPGGTATGLGGRRPEANRHRLIAGVLMVASIVAIPTTIGSAASAASTAIPATGCTVVSHPTAKKFTNCPGADLAGATLSGVDLSFANFAGANLSGANLSAAELRDADLSNASLTACG